MRFARCVYPKVESVEFSSRKVAAVNRRLQRNRDAVALLPDLVAKVPTPEQDMAATVSGTARSNKEWRDMRAAQWRRARRALDAMPENQRRGVVRYWNEWVQRGQPGDPGYLLTHIQSAEQGVSFWGRMRQLRQLSLIGQGRLPRSLFFALVSSEPAYRRRDWLDRNQERFRRKRSRKLGIELVETQKNLSLTT